MVNRAKKYITDGDIFQVLPSQRFTAKCDKNFDEFSFYRSLRLINPSPFLFYLKFDDFVLTGSSPEIMVSLKNKKITIRPLAGTRKRGKNEAEDKQIAAELLNDEKEVAEHLMLIDLGRHDVGSVSAPGSVVVTEKMIVENYSHVMHISSNVEGILRNEFDALDALIAGFPAGTVSGAPKIRAMEIIEEMEKVRRSFYAGCVGYFASNGDMETCITLRSALIKNGYIHLQTGAGVVFDSDPQSEYQECLNKARVLMSV
jgi:anthranilate synthase component 1